MSCRPLLLSATALLPLAVASAAEFYVAAKQGIFHGQLDESSGKLSLRLAAPARDPGFLALAPSRKCLYAGLSRAVAAFTVQPGGDLRKLNELDSGGEDPCHITMDRSGRYLFAANYDTGTVATFSTKPDGALDQRLSLLSLEGSGPDKKRQEKSHAHAAYLDESNRFLYACDLGSDRVWVFRFDETTGALSLDSEGSGVLPPGSGPRHLAFSRNERFAYVVGEMGGGVTTLSRNAATGALTAVHTSHPPSTQDASMAEIAMHPSGKWLYVSNRQDHTISVYEISADGRAWFSSSRASEAKTVRSFALSPDGQWLVAAGQSDGRLVVFRVDPGSGALVPTSQQAAVAGPRCVVFE